MSGCGHSAHPGQFSNVQVRTLQRRVMEWRGVMAKKLVYAASDDPAMEQRSKDQSALGVTGMTG